MQAKDALKLNLSSTMNMLNMLCPICRTRICWCIRCRRPTISPGSWAISSMRKP